MAFSRRVRRNFGLLLCGLLALKCFSSLYHSFSLWLLYAQSYLQSPKFAYATFLSPCISCNISSESEMDHLNPLADPYFTSVRLLTYQLLHAPRTRTNLGIPFIVLTLPFTPNWQIEILRKEGARIIPIQPIQLPEIFDPSSLDGTRFRDVLAKLRLWQLTEFDRILFLDGDTIIMSQLDSAFTDPLLSTPRITQPNDTYTKNEAKLLQPALPTSYILAASMDTWGDQVNWIKSKGPEFMCACFMLLKPSAQLFSYYEWILSRPKAPFAAYYPDQDLLIYAFRRDGRMPWTRTPIKWSVNDGEMIDYGVKSIHVKAWEGAEGGNLGNEQAKRLWIALVEEMNAYSSIVT